MMFSSTQYIELGGLDPELVYINLLDMHDTATSIWCCNLFSRHKTGRTSQLILSVKNAHFVRCSMMVFACLICDTRMILATTPLALTIGCMPSPPSEPPALTNHRAQTLLAPTNQLKDMLLLFVNSPSYDT